MSVQFFSITDESIEPVTDIKAARHPRKYRLAVLADSAADVAFHAGGLLCDLTLSGWEVTVLVSANQDLRGLQILGVRTLDLEHALSVSARGPQPMAVAVAGDLYRHDPRVRRGVLRALEHGAVDLMMWQAPQEPELGHLVDATVQHRISSAARAFKTQALMALGASVAGHAGAEMFCSTELVACRAVVMAT